MPPIDRAYLIWVSFPRSLGKPTGFIVTRLYGFWKPSISTRNSNSSVRMSFRPGTLLGRSELVALISSTCLWSGIFSSSVLVCKRMHQERSSTIIFTRSLGRKGPKFARDDLAPYYLLIIDNVRFGLSLWLLCEALVESPFPQRLRELTAWSCTLCRLQSSRILDQKPSLFPPAFLDIDASRALHTRGIFSSANLSAISLLIVSCESGFCLYSSKIMRLPPLSLGTLWLARCQRSSPGIFSSSIQYGVTGVWAYLWCCWSSSIWRSFPATLQSRTSSSAVFHTGIRHF